jgi:hypothetical protein
MKNWIMLIRMIANGDLEDIDEEPLLFYFWNSRASLKSPKKNVKQECPKYKSCSAPESVK